MVSDVRFADDQGMVAGTEMGLQRLMNKLNDTAENFGMKINIQKTKTIVVRWDGGGVVFFYSDQRILASLLQIIITNLNKKHNNCVFYCAYLY